MDLKQSDLFWDDEGLGSINITMNPLIRFTPDSVASENTIQSYEEDSSEASLYWSESEDEVESEHELKSALEWDSSYQEDFGEVFDENCDIVDSTLPCNNNIIENGARQSSL